MRMPQKRRYKRGAYPFAIPLTKEQRQALEKLAAVNSRTMTAEAVLAIAARCTAAGIAWPDATPPAAR